MYKENSLKCKRMWENCRPKLRTFNRKRKLAITNIIVIIKKNYSITRVPE